MESRKVLKYKAAIELNSVLKIMSSLSLSNPSQLIVRNMDCFELDHLLMIGLPGDQLVSQLLDEGLGRVTALTRDFSDYRRLKPLVGNHNDRFFLTFAPVLEEPLSSPVDGVLIFLQKSKPLMDFWLEMIRFHVAANVPIYLVGENDEGIKSWKKRLKQSFSDVKSVDNARHCVLLEACGAMNKGAMNKPDQFTEKGAYKTFTVQAMDKALSISSLPGVFSHGRLDVGTEVLLETLNDLPSGNVLDFGCGAGVISAYISEQPEERHLTLVDCDAMALASSRKTMNDLGVENFQVLASDGLSEVTGQFDLIISNPPFHQGVKTHYEVTERFLSESHQKLKVGGELRIVANSFLKYPPIIEQTFGRCETLLSRNGFSIYRAFKKV
ncbi:class I SAM-dependent methyltransferase [Endozoicomonas ascidiicola]|uniref:class I SAM-dependent methyltransferase n=1 Tax=Endozoicomonas ascidiicola TaxID=1698521 RepID=UPI001561A2B7|nr:class I SAM-dependent methyltransferase [Endozoicomonas ascidiicola]